MKTKMIRSIICSAGALSLWAGAASTLLADYATEVLSLSPVGYWRLNDTPTDSSGNGNHGSWQVDSGAYAVGPRPPSYLGLESTNNAGSFNNSRYITAANEANFDFSKTSSFSLSAFVKTSNTTDDDIIIAKSENAGDFKGYYLITGPGAGQKLQMFLQGTTTADIIVRGSTSITDGAWHQVVVTYNGNTLASGLKLYVDGVLESPTVISDDLGLSDILTNESLNLGARAAGGVPFNGLMDEAAVFGSELTGGQIGQLYEFAVTGVPEPTAVGLLAFGALLLWARKRRS